MDKESEHKLKFERYKHIFKQKLQFRKWEEAEINRLIDILELSLHDPVFDRALGSIFGATIGDALGSYCEFMHHLQEQTIDQAMNMDGGGTFNLEAGQFTDDSELAAHLLEGLSHFNENGVLDRREEQRIVCKIGLQYIKWVESHPFDIGNTTRSGISVLRSQKNNLEKWSKGQQKEPKFLQPMFNQIYNYNQNSMANGSVMRISPFAFFFALTGQNPREHSQFIKDQSRLTHPNKVVVDAGVAWVTILTELITRKDNNPETFGKILNVANQKEFISLQTWVNEGLKPKQQAMKGVPNMGFVKIAFSYGLRVLNYLSKEQEKRLNDQMYFDWMRWVISRAGDTDTNGAIVGGLMGSIIGFWELPQKFVARSLKTITNGQQFKIFDKQQQIKVHKQNPFGYTNRNVFYQPSSVLATALKLFGKLKTFKKGN